MRLLDDYLPTAINSSRWLTSYSLFRLRECTRGSLLVLPICQLGTDYKTVLKACEAFVDSSVDPVTRQSLDWPNWLALPPLFEEALDSDLETAIIEQIRRCFPHHELSSQRNNLDSPQLAILRVNGDPQPVAIAPPRVAAFSVDTAVEEHGPHLPLSTDTIQSYSVLNQIESTTSGFVAVPPVEYGHLTWGLPFGFSIDLTPTLLTRYVSRFANAVQEWLKPDAIYAVDVHGSVVHRRAIVEGMECSDVACWGFRWLHEPLTEFSSDRGDQHAGGVETALVERVASELLDKNWWPARIHEIAANEMTLEKAVELTADLPEFFAHVESEGANGIIGVIRNYDNLDADELFNRMVQVATQDVAHLLRGESIHQVAGDSPWEK